MRNIYDRYFRVVNLIGCEQKTGAGDTVIRRNSLTTLHPLPHAETHVAPVLERQKTVPHGFNVGWFTLK